MDDAEAMFSETFGRFMSNWSYVMSLRQVAEIALPLAQEALAPIHGEAIEAIAADQEYSKIFAKSSTDAEAHRLKAVGLNPVDRTKSIAPHSP